MKTAVAVEETFGDPKRFQMDEGWGHPLGVYYCIVRPHDKVLLRALGDRCWTIALTDNGEDNQDERKPGGAAYPLVPGA